MPPPVFGAPDVPGYVDITPSLPLSSYGLLPSVSASNLSPFSPKDTCHGGLGLTRNPEDAVQSSSTPHTSAKTLLPNQVTFAGSRGHSYACRKATARAPQGCAPRAIELGHQASCRETWARSWGCFMDTARTRALRHRDPPNGQGLRGVPAGSLEPWLSRPGLGTQVRWAPGEATGLRGLGIRWPGREAYPALLGSPASQATSLSPGVLICKSGQHRIASVGEALVPGRRGQRMRGCCRCSGPGGPGGHREAGPGYPRAGRNGRGCPRAAEPISSRYRWSLFLCTAHPHADPKYILPSPWRLLPRWSRSWCAAGLPGKTRFFVYASKGSLPGKHLADLGKGSWDQLGRNTHGTF